jgi:hypothetical protein
MKNNNLHIILIVFVSLLFLQGCKKNPSSPGNNTGGLNIKGNFNSYSSLSVKKLDAPQAAKVIVFYPDVMGGAASDIANGSFDIQPFKGKPIGLVFADASNHYLGYLTMGSGVDSMPLNMLDTDVTTIDLQSITITADTAIPGHNPVGNEIPMTAADITAYAFSNGIFATLLKNPDVDGDGIVDVLENSFYKYSISYGIKAGVFSSPTDLTPTLNNPVTISGYSMDVIIHDPAGDPASVNMQGAPGSGIENVALTIIPNGGIWDSYIFRPSVPGNIPPAGAYVVTYGSKTLTFNVPDQTIITKYMVIIVPTVILNADNTIHEITWTYKLSDGSTTVDPKTTLLQIGVQLAGGSGGLYQYYSDAIEQTEHVLTDQTVPWSSVTLLDMTYNDIFGNNAVIGFDKP